MPYRNTQQFETNFRVYTTLALMRADNDLAGATDGPEVALLVGGAAAFDGTSALYAWNKDSVAADNNGSVIAPTNVVSSGRWIQQVV